MSDWKMTARAAFVAIAATTMAWSSAAWAAEGSGHIKRILSYGGHNGILVELVEGFPNPDGCGGPYLIYPDTSPRAEFVQSMLLTQIKSGKRVYIWTSGCSEGYPKIVHIAMDD